MDNSWKEFHDLVWDAINVLKTEQGAFSYAFPDSYAARGQFMQAQPGDMMLLWPRRAILIEVKYSEVHLDILSMLKSEGAHAKRQLAKHRLWHRAGHPSLFVFRRKDGKVWTKLMMS